jgi:FlaA1/EpsC-like NDP-sugar epimerase
VERFFLTMDETVHRVLSAATTCPDDGAIAIPLMGQPVRIADLARYLIAQSSESGISIVYSGLRPGDKMREEFVLPSESTLNESVLGLKWISSPRLPEAELASGLADLDAAMEGRNLALLLAALTRLVPEYQPSEYLTAQIATAAAT